MQCIKSTQFNIQFADVQPDQVVIAVCEAAKVVFQNLEAEFEHTEIG